MPIEYVNRRGQTYYLHVGVTKTGKLKYFVAQNTEGTLSEVMPPGFEIYENPNAQVVVRKSLPQLIYDAEIETVEQIAERLGVLQGCRIERKLTMLIVHFVDQSAELFEEIEAMMRFAVCSDVDAALNQFRTYSPKLRFRLIDADKRIFQPQRFCYLGSIDDWVDIGQPDTLEALSQRYLPHLGQDSYYELF